jgi:citrate synthase
LEGVTVARTRLSRVDGEAGELVVGGFPVGELAANATYEEALYLLFHYRLPDADELAAFREDLAARREIGDAVRGVLRQAAAEGRPAMAALRQGVAAADLGTGDAGRGPAADETADGDAEDLVVVVFFFEQRYADCRVEPTGEGERDAFGIGHRVVVGVVWRGPSTGRLPLEIGASATGRVDTSWADRPVAREGSTHR